VSPLDDSFKEELDRLDHGLTTCQDMMKGLFGRAKFDQLPKEIPFMLERKAIGIGHLERLSIL
jgi:hypothetical protein